MTNKPNKRQRKNMSSKQQLKQMVNSMLASRIEKKFFDSTVSQNVGTSWYIATLTQDIIQGTGGGQRIGDNIKYADLWANYRIGIGAGTATDIRIVIALDSMCNGVAPVYTDLFVNSNLTSTYSAQQIKENRFKIIYDYTGFVAVGGKNDIVMQRHFKLSNVCSFLATTSVAGANGRNSMWLFLISSENTNKPGFNMDFQVRYTDA